ncbi:MAG: dienelactone hydrolase family protein [Candidatus Saccharimonas sp.]|nr:dienelactone hydrolase family protein [Planctomycetaceae bacterium]
MLRSFALMFALLLLAASADAAVQTKKITYKHGNLDCHGYLAWDDAVSGARPGVLVVHEWWGLDGYAKRRAEQLAKLGYIAFAADMYGEGKTVDHPKDATAMAGQVRSNVEDWRQRGLAALEVLKSQPQCDKSNLAAIGYCFGGSTVQQLAFAGTDLKAVASFHGGLVVPTPEQVKGAKAQILICNGADDTFISAETIKSFRAALDTGGAKYEFISYPGARHSFTVPEADEASKKFNLPGLQYNKAADEQSWADMQKLFKEKLGK